VFLTKDWFESVWTSGALDPLEKQRRGRVRTVLQKSSDYWNHGQQNSHHLKRMDQLAVEFKITLSVIVIEPAAQYSSFQ
jgi:hypothetical protein